MRQELLDAYWDVVREGLTFKQAAGRRGVNRGTLYRICKTSNISRHVERPVILTNDMILYYGFRNC